MIASNSPQKESKNKSKKTVDKIILEGDPQYEYDNPPQTGENCIITAYRKLSYFWSTGLLIFAIFVMYYDIAKDWANDFDDNSEPGEGAGSRTPVAINIIFVTILLFWVAILEGAQVSIVGLSAVDIEKFRYSHPQSYATCKLLHEGANLEKFIVGRQFLLLFVVFIISRLGGHAPGRVDEKTNNGDFYIGDWHWHTNADLAFMQNNILLMIVIIVPGQLVSQLLAAGKMLAFLELPFFPMYTVAYPSLLLEFLGITHCAYVIKDITAKLAGVQSQDPDKEHNKNWFYYLRCTYSVLLVMFSAVVIVKGLLAGQTNVWDTLPGYGALLLSIFFLFLIGCCEGFQIAAVALSKIPAEELKEHYPMAYTISQTLYSGRNLQAFLVGRQVLSAIMMVLLARVTTFSDADDDVWGFAQWAKDGFLTTGILGAVFVVNVGQLSFRMMAINFPTVFINNFIMYGLLSVALVVEATGVVNSCWPLAWGLDRILKLQSDLNVFEERDLQTPPLLVLGGSPPVSPAHDETIRFTRLSNDATSLKLSYV
eukprot:m.95182 g.95182  ORF g.95182 m.95182 type:complete len:539 (+) comp13482_c0_seq2:196-1812(+)